MAATTAAKGAIVDDDDGLGASFWWKMVGLVVLGGIAARDKSGGELQRRHEGAGGLGRRVTRLQDLGVTFHGRLAGISLLGSGTPSVVMEIVPPPRFSWVRVIVRLPGVTARGAQVQRRIGANPRRTTGPSHFGASPRRNK